MQQGEIWLADLGVPAGRRPVVVLTRSGVLPHLSRVTIIPLTTNIRPISTHVRLTQADGISRECAASADNIGTLEKALLSHRLAQLSPAKIREIFSAIRIAFDMPE